MAFARSNDNDVREQQITPKKWPGEIEVLIDPKTPPPWGSMAVFLAIAIYAMGAADRELLENVLWIVAGGFLGNILGKIAISLKK